MSTLLNRSQPPTRRRRSTRPSRRKGVAAAAAFAVLIVALVATGLILPGKLHSSDPTEVGDNSPSELQTLKAYVEPTAKSPKTLAEVMPRLADSARPFNVVVLSDSTGIPREGWVALMGQWMGDTYDRPVVGHPWNVRLQPPGYDPADWHVRTDGAGAQVTLWNASASSQNAQYSLDHLNTIVPSTVDPATIDMVFVSHGHNQKPGTLRSMGIPLMQTLAKKYTNAVLVNVMENPEKVAAPHAVTQDQEVAAFAAWTATNDIPTIDVHAAFLAQPNWQDLMDQTLYHPTPQGHVVWFDAIKAALTNPSVLPRPANYVTPAPSASPSAG